MQTTITDRKRLIFLKGKKILIVQPSQIIRMEAFSNYTYVYFTDRPPILMAKVLHIYDELLRPHGFVRTHKSHLINPLFVKELNREGTILMRDDSIVNISRSRKSEVFKNFFGRRDAIYRVSALPDVTRFIASPLSDVETQFIASLHPAKSFYLETSKKLVS